MKQRLSHFCVHVADMNKAIEFYRDKLGFEVEYQSDDWSELKLNDKINLALQTTTNPGPGIGFVVENCQEATLELADRGVNILLNCDERDDGKMTLTQFTDPDGDVIWMTERKK